MKEKRLFGSLGIKKKCLWCEKKFRYGNARYGFRRVYCSHRCWRRFHKEKHKLENLYIPFDFNENLSVRIKSSIAKGKALENWVAERLISSGLDGRARRTMGSGSGREKGDVNNDLGLNIECKNTKTFNPKAVKQSMRDAQAALTVPVVVWHPPQVPMEDSIVIITWGFFEELLLRRKDPVIKKPDREFKWKMERLIQYTRDVIKELEQ